MSLIEHLTRQLRYDDWANRETSRSLGANAPPKSVRLLAHIVATEFLWLDRMSHRPARCAVWPDWSVVQSSVQLDQLPATWANFFRGLDDKALATSVAYVNTKGAHFKNTVGDITTHVLAHGAYHRGQIASSLRDAGIDPAYTDFIHAVRVHGL